MKVSAPVFAAVIVFTLAACTISDKKKEPPAPPPSVDSATVSELPPTVAREFNEGAPASAAKDSVLFKFNLQKGKLYDYNMDFSVMQQAQSRTSNTDMKWSYSLEVADEKKKIKTIKVTYKKIEMSMDMGGQKMEFSSEKKVETNDLMQLPSKMFAAIKGKSFTMEVNEKGEILSVSGFDRIGEVMVNELNLPAESKPMMLQRFKKQFNDNAVKEIFSQAFNIFPNKTISTGDSWVRRPPARDSSKLNTTTTFTVKNIKDGKVYLDMKSNMDGGSRASGTQTGQMVVSAATGLVLDAVFNEKIKGEGTVNSKGRITGKERPAQ
jgi:hypothetical protein